MSRAGWERPGPRSEGLAAPECAKILLTPFDMAWRLFRESPPISRRGFLLGLLQVQQSLATSVGNMVRQTPAAGRPAFYKPLAGKPKQVTVEGTPIRRGTKLSLHFIWRKKSVCLVENG